MLWISSRLACHHLCHLEVIPYQWATLHWGLVPNEEDRVSEILEDSIRYMVTVGWMVFDQMATMNEHIPLYGNGGYKQLRGDVVDHNKRLETMERRYEELDKQVDQVNNSVYQGRVDIERWLDELVDVNLQLQLGLH
jgi:hypothetical protein